MKRELIKKIRLGLIHELQEIDGYYELEALEMDTIPGFNRKEFKKYMFDGSGEYTENQIQDLITQAHDKVIKKTFNNI